MLSGMRLFLYFVFIISGAESLNVPMCNTEMKMGASFIKKMYANYPNPLMYDGQQYSPDGCYNFFRGRYMDNYWTTGTGKEKDTCIGLTAGAKATLLAGYAALASVVLVGFAPAIFLAAASEEAAAIGVCKSARDRINRNCVQTYIDAYNQYNLLNFQFQPWPTAYGSAPIKFPGTLGQGPVDPKIDPYKDAYGEFELHLHQGPVQSHVYQTYNQGKGTLWTELQIVWPAMNMMDPYGLDTSLIGSILKFNQFGLLGFSNEVTFSALVSQKGIIIKNGGVYGIYMAGCTPPVIYIRVTYQSSSERPSSVAYGKYASRKSPFTGLLETDTIKETSVAVEDDLYGNCLTRGFSCDANSDFPRPPLTPAVQPALGGAITIEPLPRARRLLSVPDIDIDEKGLSPSPTSRRLHQTSQSECYKRVIQIYDIKPDSNTMACMAAPPLSKIESSLVSKTDTVDTMIIKLQEKLYAQSTTSDKYFIALSKGQAQVLVTCAQSVSYWKYFENSPENSQPGMCMPCKALASNTFTVPVSCPSKDCCNTCKTYPKKYICFNCDSDGLYVEDVSQCKPQCAKFEAFNQNSQCTKCSLGKTIAFINTIAFIFSAFFG